MFKSQTKAINWTIQSGGTVPLKILDTTWIRIHIYNYKMCQGYLQVRETPPETSAGHSSGPAAKNNNIKTGFNQLVEVESVLRIHDILVRIWIRRSMPLTN